jgi:hypothetical protein
VRWIGALAIGGAIAICPMLAVRSLETLLHPGATPEERRAAEERRTAAIRRATAFFVIPVLLVGLVAYARATSPATLGGTEFSPIPGAAPAISPLSWQAIALLGLVSIVATAAIEHYRLARRGAVDAHIASFLASAGAAAADVRMRNAERRLAGQGGRWTSAQVSEEHSLRGLSSRNASLHAEWANGAGPFVEHDLHVAPSGFEIAHPAPMQLGLSDAAHSSVHSLEHRAGQLALAADPFAVVIPRRELPPLLRAARQMTGVSHPHAA